MILIHASVELFLCAGNPSAKTQVIFHAINQAEIFRIESPPQENLAALRRRSARGAGDASGPSVSGRLESIRKLMPTGMIKNMGLRFRDLHTLFDHPLTVQW